MFGKRKRISLSSLLVNSGFYHDDANIMLNFVENAFVKDYSPCKRGNNTPEQKTLELPRISTAAKHNLLRNILPPDFINWIRY